MRISYGGNNIYRDITTFIPEKCHVENGQYVIPAGDEIRANLFGDPVFGIFKHIIVELNGQTFKYSHEQELRVPMSLFKQKHGFEKYRNNYLVETGTYEGDGVKEALDSGFKNIISYEISPRMFLQANERFKNNPNVLIYLKPSQTLFEEIKDIEEPITFWLDAHFSSGNPSTSFYQVYCPLLLELNEIAKHPIKTHTILINKVSHFNTPESNFITKQEVEDKLLTMNKDYQIEYENDVMIVSIPKYITKYTAMIIEPREHPALDLVLNNFNRNLDKEWSFVIFHGKSNKQFIDKIVSKFDRQIKMVDLGVDNLTTQEYNKLMFDSHKIYDHINTDMFLVFQVDSLLSDTNAGEIYKFMSYDYVGAPWHISLPFHGVGNGGLSLRRKSKVLETLEKCQRNNGFIGYSYEFTEDIVFSGIILNIAELLDIKKPSVDEAMKFSVETIFYENPVGIHKPWRYINRQGFDILKKNFHDLEKLLELSK